MRGKGSASMKMTGKLRAVDGGTEVINISELNVVGILAQMGGARDHGSFKHHV